MDRTACSRRTFVSLMAALVPGAMGWPAALSGATHQGAAPARTPPGIQLYSLRAALQANTASTLHAIAGIGYRRVELAGTYGHSAQAFRGLLDAAGLVAPSSHLDLTAVSESIDRTIDEAHILGHRYVIVPWLDAPLRTVDGYARVAEALNRAGERLGAAGLRLGYHNHAFEFDLLPDGRCGYDILLTATDPRYVTMELDLFWMRKGGRDPLQYFARHPRRFALVHIKDMAADGAMVDVGAGTMDWRTLLRTARDAGVTESFVEHDEPTDGLAFARTSWAYLQQLAP